ncbi:SDR family oxidoreductase [Streptacidiphilus cavernicola]|uniref:SDR family oxidoreductase n=1 Tax=Streptacidiphilus cavernicola TaxID=3342716 RepID=A0ABV6VQ24_9ACTN
MKVLVAGASGYLGQYVVRALQARGHQVRALARNRERLRLVVPALDEVVVADATDPSQLVGCCEGIDVVFSSIGLVGRRSGKTCWDVDYNANRNLLYEARRAGVGKFIYTSVVRSPGLEKVQLVRAKRAFEVELESSGLDFTILYPNGFFSDMTDFLAMARRGRVYLFGNGGFRINPIDGSDVAGAAADALTADIRHLELGGPQLLTHERIAQEAFHAAGNPERITHIPAWALKAVLSLLRRTTPVRTYGPIEFPLTVLTQDVIAPACGHRELADYFRYAVGADTASR